MPKSLDILRAEYAYEKVSNLSEKTKQYLSLVRSFPIMIHNNGYAAAIAFLYSKKKGNNEYNMLYTHILEWLRDKKIIDNGSDLMQVITKSSNEEYRRLSNETISLLIWLKRFAEGMISDGSESSTNNDKNSLPS